MSCQSPQAGTSNALFRGPINATGSTSQSTVLIVPTNEADKATEQRIHDYVRGMQKFIQERSPGRDVKVLTDAEALQADLSQSSVSVYGTPQGNLWLARYIAALPVIIEPNGITADRLYKGSNLRFISTWPHPQNPKMGVVIYTAQRADDVVGINGVMHGPTVVRSADYVTKEVRWTFPSFKLDLTQATEDLDFFFKTIEQVHPNYRANMSKADCRRIKDHSRAALKQACDRNGQVPISVLALTAAEAGAAFGDGHTACRLPAGLPDPSDPSPCMPPFRLRWEAGHVVIGEAIGGLEHLANARLLQINGKPLEETLTPVLARVSGERQAFRMKSFLDQQEVCWALVRPVQGDKTTVTIRRGADEPQTVSVPLISLERYRRELPAGPGRNSGGFHEFRHDGRTCYWQYNSFDASDSAKKAIDAVFKDIRDRGARNLIIDLRFNGGGNSEAAEYILSYITNEPYCVYSRVDAKLSKQFLRMQRFGWLTPLVEGRVFHWRNGGKLTKPADVEYRFEGSVYAIIGAGTFSSASDFAHVLKDFRIGTLVGEETGGLRHCFGDCPSFRMPHSNLLFTVSTKRFYAPIPKPDDEKRGTVPDIETTDERLARFMETDDPELAFVLDWIEKGGQPDTAPDLREAAGDKRHEGRGNPLWLPPR
jgi:hypothetical protein